jgi:TrmH family RNA methyltransferase
MDGLSHSKAKQIRLLSQKKHRQEQGLFLIEGAKIIREALSSGWPLAYLLATPAFAEGLEPGLTGDLPIYIAGSEILERLSTFHTAPGGILVAQSRPPETRPDESESLWLVLDRIADPGNMGTIIRLADWFGLGQILLLGDCVEWWNPKVVAASMGSILRIRPVPVQADTLRKAGRNWFAADTGGQSLYTFSFPARSILLIGNESAGLGKEWLTDRQKCLSIPSFGKAESLNAALATGILLNHWRMGMESTWPTPAGTPPKLPPGTTGTFPIN